ncbi:MAG: PAS domain-containing protein [Bacteroidia bacterium]|nr:PAS domain-containing protein [Bacteroidia bacterium]
MKKNTRKKSDPTIVQKASPDIVAIGASAGGLDALQELFTAMPVDSGLAFVVIQHLSPDYKSLMNELLARHTSMAIHIAEHLMELESNHVYLIPPGKNISVFHNKIFLEPQNHTKSLNLPVDIFFKSLAKEKGNKAIGIVLSGTGSDGTLGTKAIKEAGGMIMAQDTSSARFDGMPKSCISTGLVDFILSPAQMPEALLNFIRHPFSQGNKPIENILTRDITTIAKICMILRDHCGIDFTWYKENTIIRRLERRVSINRLNSIDEYLEFLNSSTKEKETLYRELLIGVTSFFRDGQAFATMENHVIPALLENRPPSIRIWSTGCSTGEEVYSLAMMVQDYLDKNNLSCDLKIFATDVDKHALEQASSGFYSDSIAGDIDQERLNKYFTRREAGYQINENIRKSIVFARHNLLKDPPFSKLDLLVCRNLFIYLKPEMQNQLLTSFFYSLKPGSYLFMGSSETLGSLSDAFETVDNRWKIYRVKRNFKLHDTIRQSHLQVPEMQEINPNSTIPQEHRSKAIRSEFSQENLLNILAPPTVIIDEQDNLLQLINDTTPYLTLRPGKFSQILYDHLQPEFGVVLKTLIQKARKERMAFLSESVSLFDQEAKRKIRVDIRNLQTGSGTQQLISFKEEPTLTDNENTDTGTEVRINLNAYEEIKRELQYTKVSLQATVEELETANEELQSSNEELIASNEELQSTNEELQSVNEELFTVNSEFQSKINELTKTNTDIHNLLRNTEVGALYLDSRLCIRKLTPLVSNITHILPTDSGRPIAHISLGDVYPGMVKDIEQVAENLQPIENEIQAANGTIYQVRILPYRTENNAIEGILITFVNITRIKTGEIQLKLTTKRLQEALGMGRMAWWEWDRHSGKVLMDDRKATMLGYTLEEFPKDIYGITALIHPDDYEKTMQDMREHLEGRAAEWISTYRIKRKDGSYGWYFDRGVITERDEKGMPLTLVGTVIDVSRLKDIELDKLNMEKTLESTFDLLDTPLVVVSPENSLRVLNTQFAKILDVEREELLGKPFPSAKLKLKIGGRKVAENYNLYEEALQHTELFQQNNFSITTKEGKLIKFRFRIKKSNKEPEPIHAIILSLDIRNS